MLLVFVLVSAADQPGTQPLDYAFSTDADGEAVATIIAGCEGCDWGLQGREAAALRVSVDGTYSQHVLLFRGQAPSPYRIVLGPVAAGSHRLTIERDPFLSAPKAGAVTIERVDVRTLGRTEPDYEWMSRAPFLYARPDTAARFSDIPVLAWAEASVPPARGFRYSVIFTHEDGGTPTDRLMATWGRTTDIEFAYGAERDPDGALREELQGPDHEILPFRGQRLGRHPLLWVATDNNMFSDTGPDTIRFAPAPELVTLDDVSREVVMDRNPWTYAVMTAELQREGRIDPEAQPGSAKIPDPRQFAYLEACGDVHDATLAFDIGVARSHGRMRWFPSDRGDARFRVARSGCFRAAVPLGPAVTRDQLRTVRLRAYTLPPRDEESPLPRGAGRATLRRLNTVFMLDSSYRPVATSIRWSGTLRSRGEAPAVPIPAQSFRSQRR